MNHGIGCIHAVALLDFFAATNNPEEKLLPCLRVFSRV